MLAVPVIVELKMTGQEAVPTVTPVGVHGLPMNEVPETIPFCVKDTVPVGVVGEAEVSVTVAVQWVSSPKGTLEGAHDTVVVVVCAAAREMLTVVLPVLVPWTVASPR